MSVSAQCFSKPKRGGGVGRRKQSLVSLAEELELESVARVVSPRGSVHNPSTSAERAPISPSNAPRTTSTAARLGLLHADVSPPICSIPQELVPWLQSNGLPSIDRQIPPGELQRVFGTYVEGLSESEAKVLVKDLFGFVMAINKGADGAGRQEISPSAKKLRASPRTTPTATPEGPPPLVPLLSPGRPSVDGIGMLDSLASVECRAPAMRVGHMQHSAEDDVVRICEFEVIAELGRGGFGTVSLALDTTDGSSYAIKTVNKGLRLKGRQSSSSAFWGDTPESDTLPPSSSSGQFSSVCAPPAIAVPPSRTNSSERISAGSSLTDCRTGKGADAETCAVDREIAVMKRLRHRNVVRLLAVIEDPTEDQTHLVMEYVENGPVAKMRTDGTCRPVPYQLALYYMSQVSSGLDYLHHHEVLHRDIKPENILIGKNHAAYISDFGVSDILTERRNFSTMAGTMAFMSPELMEEGTEVGKWGKESDVWAFGVSLFVLLFGHLPFNGWNGPSLFRAVLHDELAIPELPTAAHSPARKRYSVFHTSQLHPVLFQEEGEDAREAQEQLKAVCSALLKKDPTSRMTLREFRHHPFVVRTATKFQTRLAGSNEHQQSTPPTSQLPPPDSSEDRSNTKEFGFGDNVPWLAETMEPEQLNVPPCESATAVFRHRVSLLHTPFRTRQNSTAVSHYVEKIRSQVRTRSPGQDLPDSHESDNACPPHIPTPPSSFGGFQTTGTDIFSETENETPNSRQQNDPLRSVSLRNIRPPSPSVPERRTLSSVRPRRDLNPRHKPREEANTEKGNS